MKTFNQKQIMKKQILVLSVVAAGFITMPSFAGQAGCCSGMGAMQNCSAMSGHDTDPVQTSALAEKLTQPVAAVFDNYARIQTALAQDSLKDVAKEAQAMAKTINDDSASTFPKNVAQKAGAVAKATDLHGAREAFKPLSQSLIAFVSKNPSLAGTYRQVHCPMANADWLQKEAVVNNPYMGKEMLHCGEFVKSSDTGKHGQ
jgi:hypothetical protein